jgi:hypothetical protein
VIRGSFSLSIDGAADFDPFLFSLPDGTQLQSVTYTYSNVNLVEGTSELGAAFLIRTLDFSDTCASGLINVATADTATVIFDECLDGNLADFEFLGGIWSWQQSLSRTGPLGGGGSWDYTLSFHVTSVTEPVTIDIKPGKTPNRINPASRQKIAVAILYTESFDATQVNWETVEFGPDGATEFHGRSRVKDVDRDGDMDLLLHFDTQDTGIACGDTEATLTGETFSGDAIAGTDTIVTMNCP